MRLSELEQLDITSLKMCDIIQAKVYLHTLGKKTSETHHVNSNETHNVLCLSYIE